MKKLHYRPDSRTVINAPSSMSVARGLSGGKELACGDPSIMLAGGTSDWRTEMIELMNSFPGTLLNPIRKQWPEDEEGLRRQIEWERQALRESTLCLFWFHAKSDCPNTMLELGYALRASHPIVVGIAPGFRLRRNLNMFLNLEKPELLIANNLEQLATQAFDFFAGGEQK